jgi:toxin YoeB
VKLVWTELAWENYLFWQQTNKDVLKKINVLIKDILREPFSGIGKPEALRFEFTGKWSRRIDAEHRLIYQVKEDELIIYQCRYHY